MTQGSALQKRIDWVDTARAIGILAVVLCHAKVPLVQKYAVGPFEVTIFFFISGYLFFKKEQPDLKTFLTKKVKALLLPYAVFSVMWMVYDWCFLCIDGTLSVQSAFKVVLQYGLQIRMKPIWFLTCLFLSECALYIIVRLVKNKKIFLFATAAGMVCLAYAYYRFVNKALPWNADLCLVASPFMLAGYLARAYGVLEHIHQKARWIVFFASTALYLAINYLNVREISGIDLFYNQFGNMFVFFASALAAIVAVIAFCKILPPTKVLTYIGRNSLFIFATHNMIIAPLLRFLPYDLEQNDSIAVLIKIGIFLLATAVCCMLNAGIMKTRLKKLLGK